ncbi:MAG: aspartate/glutamate racemase family protein, partial [Polyangiales bacterium]
GRVGVLATAGTVASGAYERAIHRENKEIHVFAQPAPLFVPLAEEGWTSGEVPELAARRYLEPLVSADVDTIVLGCTHYPLLSEVIHQVARDLLGHDVVVVDSAAATAETLASMVSRPSGSAASLGSLRVRVTDLPEQFASSASRFLGEPVEGLEVQAVDL